MWIRKVPPSKMIVVGLALLALASTAQWYLRRHSGLSEDATDFVDGLLYGVAIATLLIAIWRQGRAGNRRD